MFFSQVFDNIIKAEQTKSRETKKIASLLFYIKTKNYYKGILSILF